MAPGTIPAPVAAPNRSRDLKALIAEEEAKLDCPQRRRLRLATLVVPVLVTLGLLALAAVWRGPELAGQILLAMVAVFTVLGKFAIPFGAGEGIPFGPWEIALLVAYMDIAIAFVLVLNLPTLYRLPRMGPVLEDLAEHGTHMLERRPALSRITFLGVVLFVMFPLTGTGAVGGSIFGRLLGLSSRRTLFGIATGAVLGCSAMAAFSSAVRSAFPKEVRESWQFQAIGGALILLTVALIWQRGRKLSAELKARRAARESQSPDEAS